MNKFVSELKAQQEELEVVIRYANQILKKAPEGSLRVSHEDDRPQYYHRTTDQENNVVMTYLRKRTSMDLIQTLAQKSYAQKNTSNINIISFILKVFADCKINLDI